MPRSGGLAEQLLQLAAGNQLCHEKPLIRMQKATQRSQDEAAFGEAGQDFGLHQISTARGHLHCSG